MSRQKNKVGIENIIWIDENLSVIVEECMVQEDEWFEIGGYVFRNCNHLTDELCQSKQNKIIGTIGTERLPNIPVLEL